MPDIVSISEAAKLFNISRPRLSKLIKEFSLTKIKEGSSFKVDLLEVNDMFVELQKQGRMRKKDVQLKGAVIHHEPDVPELERKIQELQTEVKRLKESLDSLSFDLSPKKIGQEETKKGFLRELFSPWS